MPAVIIEEPFPSLKPNENKNIGNVIQKQLKNMMLPIQLSRATHRPKMFFVRDLNSPSNSAPDFISASATDRGELDAIASASIGILQLKA
jgi:hypothetical protein